VTKKGQRKVEKGKEEDAQSNCKARYGRSAQRNTEDRKKKEKQGKQVLALGAGRHQTSA